MCLEHITNIINKKTVTQMNFKFLHLVCAFLFCFGQMFAQTKYEAEDATLDGCSALADADASGGKCVPMQSGDAHFDVNVDAAGVYNLIIAYRLTADSEKYQNLEVNGSSVGQIHFTKTSEFKTISSVASLKQGANKVSITSSWGWIDLDYIQVEAASASDYELSGEMVTPEPTEAAQKLYAFLLENFGKKTISGFMTGDMTSANGKVKEHEDVAVVYEKSGKYPALVGFDFLNATGKNASQDWFQQYTNSALALAEDLWSQGGIPAFTWHWQDPSKKVHAFYSSQNSAGAGKDYTNFDYSEGFKPGTTEWDTESEVYNYLIEDIDHIADIFLGLQEKGVAAIFRPLHECGGKWFWWSSKDGSSQHTGDEFKALYRLVFDRMVKVKGVKNLIWVYNPESSVQEAWNPGEAYYDVISIDIYNNANDHSSNMSAFYKLKDLKTGKIIALSENGPIPDVVNMQNDGVAWSWWMPWYQSWGASFADQTSAATWKSNMEHEAIITLDEMPGWGTYTPGEGEEEEEEETACAETLLAGKNWEAECADYEGALENFSSASNKKSVNLKENTDFIKYIFKSDKACAYKIYVGCCMNYGYKQVSCAVNSIGSTVNFGETGAESEDKVVEVLAGSFNFNKGDNEILITPIWTWAAVDYIRIELDEDAPSYEFTVSDVDGFKVDGSKLLDRCGNEFVMRGVNLAYTWFESTAYAQLEAVAKAGANTVRVVLSDGKDYGKAADPADKVMAFAKKCKEYGMLTILEVHDETGSNDIADLKDAAQYFVDMADSLKGKESYIMINIANEWHNDAASTVWRDGYKEAVKMIRDAGLRHCIMVDAGGYGQGAATIHSHGLEVLDADPENNLIFSIHMYGGAGNTAKVKSNIDGVINQNLALCIGEFGWYHSDGDVDEDLILSYCAEKNVSWLAWSWYGNGSPVEYLDLVKDATANPELAVYEDIKIDNWNGTESWTASCNWGEKIINAWKAEAKKPSLDKCSTSSVEYNEALSSDIYYLAETDEIVVNNVEDDVVFISDAMGRVVFSSTVCGETMTISAKDLTEGIYFVRMNGDAVKFIK